MADTRSPTSEQHDASRKAANSVFAERNKRSFIMEELETESASFDAKTARLRALRLEKEQTDRDTKALQAEQDRTNDDTFCAPVIRPTST